MPMPTLQDFRTQFPELAVQTYPDAKITLWLGLSDPFFDQDRWDDLLFLGVLYWTAHMVVSSTANATSVTTDDALTKKVGDIMKTRSEKMMIAQAEAPYLKTPYGQQYMDLVSLVGMGGFSV